MKLTHSMKYDEHNRMTEFFAGSGVNMKTWNLKYGPLGRAFRKEEYLDKLSAKGCLSDW